MALPGMAIIRHSLPRSDGHTIDVLTDARSVDLLHGQTLFDSVIAPEWDPHRVKPCDIVASLKTAGHYDAVISFTRQVRFLEAFRRLKIPMRIAFEGFPGSLWLSREGRIPLQSVGDARSPQIEQFMHLSRAGLEALLGDCPGVPAPSVPPELVVDPTSQDELVAILGGPLPERIYTVVPGSARSRHGLLKRWPMQNFIRVAEKLAGKERGLVPVFLFGPTEEGLYQHCVDLLSRNSPRLFQPLMIEPLSARLRHVMALIRSSEFVVTNDTGPRHIAAGLGVKVVTVLGPVDVDNVTYASNLEYPVWVDVGCNSGPCKRRECREAHICMTAVTPSLVYKAIRMFVYDSNVEG